MKSARALMGMAYQDGVRLSIGDDGPRASGPPDALRRWLPLLRPHRAEVEAIIEEVEERAAILEHDGGLSRVEAEAEAVRLVIGGEHERTNSGIHC